MKSCKATFLIFPVLLVSLAFAQQPAYGPAPFSSIGGGPFDSINLGNLNPFFSIPIRHKAGRGSDFVYDLSYNASVWQVATVNGQQQWQLIPAAPSPVPGWTGLGQAGVPYIGYSRALLGSGQCTVNGRDFYQFSVWQYYGFYYHDENGTNFGFGISWVVTANNSGGQCGPTAGYTPNPPTTTATTLDYKMSVNADCCGNDVFPYVIKTKRNKRWDKDQRTDYREQQLGEPSFD